jgi:hypothetical protein
VSDSPPSTEADHIKLIAGQDGSSLPVSYTQGGTFEVQSNHTYLLGLQLTVANERGIPKISLTTFSSARVSQILLSSVSPIWVERHLRHCPGNF